MSRGGRGERETSVEIVSKAAAVIFALEAEGELTAQEVALRVGEPVSSTYRLLAELSRLGWVDRGSRRGLFRLGLLFMRIGGQVEDRIDIRRAVLPSLESLVQRTVATSFLCVRRGDRAVCIERLEGGDVRSQAMRIGDSLPLDSGAAPMAILAFLPRGERDAYLDRLAGEEGRSVAQIVEREIESVRQRGFSLSDGDVTPGIAAVAAPIFNHRGELEASVALSGLTHRILDDLGESSRLVRAAARETSRALGADCPR